MSEIVESDNQAPLQISIKRGNKIQKHKQITKKRSIKVKKKVQVGNDSVKRIKKKLRESLLEQYQYEQQKIMEQLKNMPLSLKQRENRVIKIEDTRVQKKKIKGLGIEVIQQNNRQIRKPQPNLQVKIDLNNSLRQNFNHVLARKNR